MSVSQIAFQTDNQERFKISSTFHTFEKFVVV
jgi:hypothetical protein